MNTTPATTIRTLAVNLAGVPRYSLDAIVCTLPGRAAKLWAWLRGNAAGWRFDIEQIAAACKMSVRTVWRAASDLTSAKLLEVDADTWRVTSPASVTSGTYEKPRAHARARSDLEKKKPQTHSEKRSNVVGSSGGRGVGVSGKDEQKQPEQKPTEGPPQPVKARPSHAPDHHDRPLASCADRMRIEAFLRAWTAEFRDGPSAITLPVLPAMWQQRILWLWQYWTADELREAFIATRDAVPKNGWKYFCACLERIASGEWSTGPSPHALGVAGTPSASGPKVAGELRDEVQAATQSTRSIADLARAVAAERGIDPAEWTDEQRGECVAEAMLRRREGGNDGA